MLDFRDFFVYLRGPSIDPSAGYEFLKVKGHAPVCLLKRWTAGQRDAMVPLGPFVHDILRKSWKSWWIYWDIMWDILRTSWT